VFWAHPVPRRYDDILRKKVRTKFNHYHRRVHGNNGGRVVETQILPAFLPTDPILDRMHRTEGWLEETEANLLIGATERALADLSASRAIVEVGSYCGRATVVLASVVKALRSDTKIWSINPGRSIRAIHLHRSEVRRYRQGKQNLVPGPYKRLVPEELRQ
jgi:hypothetical protein